MHFSNILTLALVGYGLASPSTTTISLLKRGATIPRDMQLTDGIAEIDLAEWEDPLGKREDVRVCKASSGVIGNCIAAGSLVSNIAIGVASLLKTDSNNHDCSIHDGRVDRFTYRAYAEGRNCDTTAQVDTIRGALAKYIHSQGNNVCGVQCLKLTHSGTWIGYVTITGGGQPLSSYYCGGSNSFGSCVSGGNNDQ